MSVQSIDLAQLAVSMEPHDSARLQEVATGHLLDQAAEVVEAAVGGAIEVPAEAVPELAQADAALAALGRLPADRQQAIVLHPAFRYWHQAVRRTSAGGDPGPFVDFIGRLAELLWAELAEDRPWEGTWWLRADDAGGIRCPSRRRYVELGSEYARASVAARVADDHVVLQCTDGLTLRVPFADLVEEPDSHGPTLEEHGYALAIAPTIADGLVEVSARDPWLRLRYTGTNQRNDGTEFFGSDDSLYPERFDAGGVEGAVELLTRYWPAARADLPRFTHVVVPITAPADAHRAFTVSSRQGAVYICAAPAGDTVEMLLHECAHIKLRQVQLLDTLLADPLDDTIRVPVPWRPDPRPIPGVFEGLYVFAHVAEYRLRAFAGADPTAAKLIEDLREARRLVCEHGRFTTAGEEFLEQMSGWLDRLEGAARAQ